LPFNAVAAQQFENLVKQRCRIGTMDLRIAAITLAHDATLLSRNLKDFRKVPGLKVEDWTKEENPATPPPASSPGQSAGR
jgi:tRNA(fMet)-specific endonuclease VapC